MSKNNYTLIMEDRGLYLYAHITGNDSFSASLSYWNEIADQVIKSNHRKLLVHENLVGHVHHTEMEEVIMDLLSSGLAEVQIAFFDENPADADLNALGQFLASERGAHIRIFSSLEDARHWIETEA